MMDLKAIVQAVAAHNSQWSWYQFDRALLAKFGEVLPLMEALAELEAQGLIYTIPVAERPGMPFYAIASAAN